MPIDTLCCFYGGLTYVVGVFVELNLMSLLNLMFLKKMFEGKKFNSFGWNPIEPLKKTQFISMADQVKLKLRLNKALSAIKWLVSICHERYVVVSRFVVNTSVWQIIQDLSNSQKKHNSFQWRIK